MVFDFEGGVGPIWSSSMIKFRRAGLEYSNIRQQSILRLLRWRLEETDGEQVHRTTVWSMDADRGLLNEPR